MAIVNATPDSFSDGGRYLQIDHALERCRQAIREGATIIDIGGESTRPGAAYVSVDEEMSRVLPVVEALRAESDIWISVDTTRSAVASAVLGAGADIINDISGLQRDPRLAETVAAYGAGVCIMHSLGDSTTMHNAWEYESDYGDLFAWFDKQIAYANASGIDNARICLDPGFGFSKNLNQNYAISARVQDFVARGFPVLVGISRKRMIRAFTGDDTYAIEHGNSAFHAISTLQGAHILRVHDVPAAVASVRVAQAIRNAGLKFD